MEKLLLKTLLHNHITEKKNICIQPFTMYQKKFIFARLGNMSFFFGVFRLWHRTTYKSCLELTGKLL